MSDLITYELEAEEKSTEREEILKTAMAKTESQHRFMSILGHDLRNPLNTILVASTLQQQENTSEPERIELAEKITRAVRRMQFLINDLLDTTQIVRGGDFSIEKKSISLREVCAMVVEEFKIANPVRKIEFYAEDECLGQWDEGRLGQVLSNLVSNALNYGRRDAPVKVNLIGEPELVVLQVNNQGNLITEEVRKNLFQPFWRGSKNNESKSNSGGLGLGLYIVKQIVEAHKGEVSVESNRDYGTTFTVKFPREAGDCTHNQ
ncbi:MAG: HAMP domain-containing sensor histidine kinase [Pyrinomonadaceae bacterium]